VLLARDPFGIKPLYYARTAGGGLAFASEIPPLLGAPGVTRRASARRAYEYLRFGLMDGGAESFYADVRQLPSAHFVEVCVDAADGPRLGEPIRYWDVAGDRGVDAPRTLPEAAERVRGLFVDSVRLHLRSDVPVGACLSGGIDSSAIVAAMRRLGGPALELHAFTYVAEDARLSEERWADLVGSATGARLHKVSASPAELAADLDGLIAAQGEPFGSTSIYAQHRVFRLAAAAGVTVMLDGQGADELFLGYWAFLNTRVASLLRRGDVLGAAAFARRAAAVRGGGFGRLVVGALGRLVPSSWQPALLHLVGRPPEPAWLNSTWFRERGIAYVPANWTRGREMLREEATRALTEASLPALLRYEDRNSMAFSIESRVPFLTPAIAQLAVTLPDDFLLTRDVVTKAVLRAALRGLVPDAVLDRRDKIGFATPEGDWLATLRPSVEATFRSPALDRVRALSAPHVRGAVDSAFTRGVAFSDHYWRWYNLVRWAERFDVEFAD
jgi:asparagine synthase (glutamine-hydrolysing)